LKGSIEPVAKTANAYNTLANALKGIMLEEFERNYGVFDKIIWGLKAGK